MAKSGTLKVGDIVTHGWWPVGMTRVVVGFSTIDRGGFRSVKLDHPAVYDAFPGMGSAELQLYNEWLEPGLLVVKKDALPAKPPGWGTCSGYMVLEDARSMLRRAQGYLAAVRRSSYRTIYGLEAAEHVVKFWLDKVWDAQLIAWAEDA